ncbi:DUF6232 family protein [Amorphoplanes digitatis]|uniref:Uncharacterized protein n=1 Tax=Actinoplanes digitatis TaxID=1868 RepID=A0A7W7MUK6_9ACTN|nr:DUF6232 family protein [Actinoplanes digitatis]MBB4766699.1 hypothetical protein [Actinoplanes digitatis]GID96203.1 hypothetical protein Adi01nite_56150 [Actinoplanes digitatis]
MAYRGPGADYEGIRRPPWRVHYANDKITVTSWYVLVAGRQIAIAHLRDPVRCLTYRYPLLRVAAITGGVEVAIGLPFALAFGSSVVLFVALFSGAGMAAGAWVDARRNPCFMTIEATVQNRPVTLFVTRDRREHGQVCRALVRAIEGDS